MFPSFDPHTPRLRFAAPKLHPAMLLRFRFLDLLCMLLLLVIVLAVAYTPARAQSANTIFLTDRNGQIPFPILPPNRATGAAGSIDNMAIGGTTPRPGAFTTLSSTSAPSGAGITALFASPPAIGGTAPAAGAFTTLSASGAVSGAGVTALFASPPAIGGTAPAAGNFTSLTTTDGLVCASYYFTGTPAATDQVFFIATRAYTVVSISEVHSVAAGGASSLQVTKDAATDAPGAGTDLLTNNTDAGFDLNGTANTVQTGTLVATAGVTTLAAGNRLAVDFADAIQSSEGVVVTACMAPR